MPEGNNQGDHIPKTYEVIKATTAPVEVEIDGKAMPFGGRDAFRVRDPGVAKAIKEKYMAAGQVTVTEIRDPRRTESCHRYFMGSMPEMPWKRTDNAD